MSGQFNKRTMEDNYRQNYLENMSKGVENMWLKQRYTDITIKVGDKAYSGHRALLGSLSNYLKEMFAQTRETVVEVTNMESATFEVILQYIYTGRVDNIRDIVEDVLKAAAALQIPCLMELCEDMLKVRLTPDTCIGIYKLASSLGCSSLAKQSWAYLMEFFQKVLTTKEFASIGVDDLISIINDDDLNTASEEVVCDAVMGWISSDPGIRGQHLGNLFNNIRFPLIGAAYIDSLGQNPVVSKSESGQAILKEFGEYLSSGKSMGTVNPRQFHHRTEEMICVVGTRSRQPNPEATEIKCFSFNRDAQFLLAQLPEEPGACYAVCTSHNDVFLAGGYIGQRKIFRYLSTENKWQRCAEMVEGRWGHAMTSVDGRIYIFGGSKKISEIISSVEMYNPSTDASSIVGNLPIPVSFMAVATVANKVYIFGGKLESRNISCKVQCFDTQTKACSIVADMPLIDAYLSRVAVVNDTVFIFYNQGDVVMFKEGEQPAIVGSIPKFDHFGVVSHSGKILIDGSFGNQSSTVLFDPTTFEITPFSRTVKMALCNFYCMGVVMSKNILNTC